MFAALVTIEILISILLMIVVLMQSSKGGGLAGSFGTGGMGTVFGVRRTADFLSRSTWILAWSFMILALVANIFFLPGKKAAAESIIQRGAPSAVTPRAVPPQTQQSAPAQTPPKK